MGAESFSISKSCESDALMTVYDSSLLVDFGSFWGLTPMVFKATVQQPGKSHDLRIDEMCKGETFFFEDLRLVICQNVHG